MRKATFVQPVASAPEAIWAFIADLRNDRFWRAETTDVRLVSGVPPYAPSVYEETIEWQGLHRTVVLCVAESVKASRVVVVTDEESSDFFSRSVWSLEPHRDSTLVTLSFSFDARGPLGFVEPFIWPTVSAWLERDLPRLEAHLSSI